MVSFPLFFSCRLDYTSDILPNMPYDYQPKYVPCLIPRRAGRGSLRLAFSRLPAPHGVIAYLSPLLVNLSYGECR